MKIIDENVIINEKNNFIGIYNHRDVYLICEFSYQNIKPISTSFKFLNDALNKLQNLKTDKRKIFDFIVKSLF